MLACTVRAFLFLLAALIGALALPAWGETAGLLLRSPTSGLDIPGTSVALEDGPAAGVVNPAGLRMQRGLALRYLHEDGIGGDGLAGVDGDGLYLGSKLFGVLGFGLSFEWLDPEPGFSGDHRRTTWSLALGDERFSLGASAHVFTHGILDDQTSWDLGLLLRPNRYLSFGFVAKDLDSTRIGGSRINRRYVAGLGLRPIGDWLTVAVDGEVLGSENKAVPHGFDSMALGYTARVRPVSGVTVYGGYTHRLDGGTDAIVAGLRLDHDHFSVEGAPLIRTSGGDVGWVAGAELRAYRERGVRATLGTSVAYVRLQDELAPPGFRLFPGDARDPMVDIVEGFAALGREESLGGVVVEIRGGLPLGFGKAWDVRQAILGLKEKGKKVAVLLDGANDATYYLASAADRILAVPGSALFVNGLQSRADFYEDSLSWLGVHMEVVRIGKYKTAPEGLTRSSISDAQREVMHSLLNDTFEGYVSTVAASRSMEPSQLERLLDVGIRPAENARDVGLVDAVVYPDEVRHEMERWLGTSLRMVDRSLRPEPWEHWSKAPVIAVIPIEGTIVAGESGGFGFAQTTGAQSVVRALESASRDPSIRSILLRIDSGGGDAGGSQLIWRAASEARRRKPVIVSMGDAAASGGYYAAVAGTRIFAAPGTVTGSIGIFWLKPNLAGLLEKLKVGTYETSRGEQAGILSFREDWTERERESIQQTIDSFYRQFIEVTAEERELTVEEVDAMAQGRVWTGAQAQERGLVDALGGLPAALQAARTEAGLDPAATVRFRVYESSSSLFSSGGMSRMGGSPLDGPVGSLLRTTVPIPILLWNGTGLWALSPLSLRAH